MFCIIPYFQGICNFTQHINIQGPIIQHLKFQIWVYWPLELGSEINLAIVRPHTFAPIINISILNTRAVDSQSKYYGNCEFVFKFWPVQYVFRVSVFTHYGIPYPINSNQVFSSHFPCFTIPSLADCKRYIDQRAMHSASFQPHAPAL